MIPRVRVIGQEHGDEMVSLYDIKLLIDSWSLEYRIVTWRDYQAPRQKGENSGIPSRGRLATPRPCG